LTVIAQLNLEQDPPVVTLLWDYRDDPAPPHMVEPEYMDVTDVDPLPQPGYTYNGEMWLPGVPQQQAQVRESIADTAEQFVAENRAFLEIAEPTDEQLAAQVASLTLQVVHLQQVALGQYGREQDWSEFEPQLDHDLPEVEEPGVTEHPDEPGRKLYSAEPDEGPTTGGFGITLHGKELTGIGGVKFERDGQESWAWGFTVVDDETVDVTIPQMSAGVADIVLVADPDDVVLEDGFTFV
jgi:hypothetical protein